jgi:hypothetical protein
VEASIEVPWLSTYPIRLHLAVLVELSCPLALPMARRSLVRVIRALLSFLVPVADADRAFTKG